MEHISELFNKNISIKIKDGDKIQTYEGFKLRSIIRQSEPISAIFSNGEIFVHLCFGTSDELEIISSSVCYSRNAATGVIGYYASVLSMEVDGKTIEAKPEVIYSFRAEYNGDVERFREQIMERHNPVVLLYRTDSTGLPDVEVEFKSSLTLEELRGILNEQIDSHVMVQTLRPVPLALNSLERDRDL